MRSRLAHLKQKESRLIPLAKDIKTLLQWIAHDVLELAGPSLAVRKGLFDCILVELRKRECKEHPNIRKLRKALQNQRDELLGFAGVLDQKLAKIAKHFDVPFQKVRDVCLLYRKRPSSNAYWQRWNQLHCELSGKFH